MFWDTITLVTDVVARLGREDKLVVFNEPAEICIADYELVKRSGVQEDRYISLKQRPFEHLTRKYRIVTATSLEQLTHALAREPKFSGPIACFDFLESLSDPFAAVRLLSEHMEPGAYLILNATFTYPYQAHGSDRWRFSPDGLRELLRNAGLEATESDWRLQIDTSGGIVNLSTGKPQEIYTCSAVGIKSTITKALQRTIPLPVRFKLNGVAIEQNDAGVSATKTKSDSNGSYRCLFLNTCYDKFLLNHYQTNPALSSQSYQIQLDSLNQTFFGDCNFYSENISKHGIRAEDIIINCAPLQMAWAQEKRKDTTLGSILYDQIIDFRPDAVYIQDMAGASVELLRFLRQRNILVIGQIACEITSAIPFKEFDIVFTSFPHYVTMLRELGIACYYSPLAFAPQITAAIPSLEYDLRPIECSFIGGISSYHSKGTQLLEHLCAQTPIQIWGYGAESLPTESAISGRHRGEAWGRNMFRLFTESKITVNRHSEAASRNANNMRLFEATGCGSLLITDYKDNLNQLFSIGKEIVAYRSAEECAALINYYLRNPIEAKEIALAGQKRTLEEHGYASRMKKTSEIITRHLEYRKQQLPIPSFDSISTDFIDIQQSEVSADLLQGWQNKEVAKSQRGLVQHEVALMYQGQAPIPFRVAAQVLEPIVRNNMSILEIGCSSGYYYEVLEYLLSKNLVYTGVDYSEAMISMAQQYYPQSQFKVADGANLPFPRHSFDLVISGCVLIHCPNYPAHIQETCRVATEYILLHRTPINRSGPTRMFEKSAYGVKTVELWFNEAELLNHFKAGGFIPISALQYETDEARGFAGISYLLQKDTREKR